MLCRIALSCVWMANALAAEPRVSLYHGLESGFSEADRSRVVASLRALGVEFEESADREILVGRHSRPVLQNLLAQLLRNPSPSKGKVE